MKRPRDKWPKSMTGDKLRRILAFAFCLSACRLAGAATISGPITPSSFVIPFESLLPNGVTIQFTLDASASVHLVATDQVSQAVNTWDQSFTVPGPGPSVVSLFWPAFWLIGDQGGRRDSAYALTLTPTGGATVPVGPLIQITSIDIHNLTVTPSKDSSGQSAAPYSVSYQLAKPGNATVSIFNSTGTLTRTLVNNVLQVGEIVSSNTVVWDGLGSDGHPAPIGVYNVVVQAVDPLSGDRAFIKFRSVAVTSLSNASSSPQKIFEDNAFVYPNPVRNGQAFFNVLPVRDGATIHLRIYTLSGTLVFDQDITAQLPFKWAVTNQAGNKLGRGLYYYEVRENDSQGTLQTVKKMAVLP